MKVRKKRRYRLVEGVKRSPKYVRLAVYGNIDMRGGKIDYGKDGQVDIYGNITVTDVDTDNLPKNVCLCGDKNQSISSPHLAWESMPKMTPEMMSEIVRAALKLHRKFSKMGKKQSGGRKKIK